MHFEQGHDYDQAIHYLVIAAENAGKRFAYRESIQILQHALELVHQVDPSRLIETELRILELIGDTQYWLGEMSASAHTYERQVARAAQAGLKAAGINAMGRLVMPLGFIDPDRGVSVAQRAVEISAGLNDPVLLAHSQMLAAGYRCIYDRWRDEDWKVWTCAKDTLCRIGDPPLPPYHRNLYSYLLLLRGEYQKVLELLDAEASSSVSDTASLMLNVFLISTRTIVLLRSGRLGELLQLVRDGQEQAAKNGNDPWLFVFREAWLRTLVFDFEGALRLCDSVISANTVYPTAQPKTIARIAQGYSELERERYDRAIECFTEVRDSRRTPKFFLHWFWRMTAQLGLSEVWMHSGKLIKARSDADGFLQSALSTADPHVQALAWELQARVAIAEQDWAAAEGCIQKALAVLQNFELPMAAWRVRATAWDLYRDAGNKEAADEHLERAASCVLRIANSFPLEEPLRQTFLAAPAVRRIVESARRGES
jgi:tetratricopeptide (TPR) repeat protein